MDILPQPFEALAHYSQFILYKIIPSSSRAGKTDKIPIHPIYHSNIDWMNPANWLSASVAIQAAKALGNNYGVGFVFTKDDPFFFIDIDNCLEDTGWSNISKELCAMFPGAAIEISNSQRGLHIFGTGVAPQHTTRNRDLNLEFYTEKRFVALTGTGAIGNAGIDFTPVLLGFVQRFFSPGADITQNIHTDTSWLSRWNELVAQGTRPEWKGSQDDNDLIRRALQSSNKPEAIFNQEKKATFKDLWENNVEVLSRSYPDATNGYDASTADIALAQHLAFWTGNNADRMRALMLRSGLNRDKWERDDYLKRTILTACSRQKNWLCDNQVPTIANEPRRIQGTRYASAEDQFEIFKDCYYVSDENKILIPGGFLHDSERFKAWHGGRSFQLDNVNQKTTKNAWEAFTQSQVCDHPKVHAVNFDPKVPYGTITIDSGQKLVNCWWDIETPRAQGDIAPFMKHMEKLFPDANDRFIMLCYMAALVQFKGYKFKWCPLIQGVEGNGKTFLSACIAYAIGHRYTHFPKATEFTNRFNSWLYRRIFAAVEDIFVAEGKQEVFEAIKPMITGDFLEIEPKGQDKITKSVCTNFMLNTNHKDGLRKTENDRRFAPFYTPQQSARDLIRDKMDSAYFSNLFGWGYKLNGFAIVCHFLYNFYIPDEYNPAILCQRAPTTTSTSHAITCGLGSIEQEILEAVEQNEIGFRGGWISSMMLDALLNRLGYSRRVPLQKRRALMQNIGYDWHPGLPEGRVNNAIKPDNGKPRLYIKNDHALRTLISPPEIAQAYTDANS